MNLQHSAIIALIALIASIAASPLWFEEDEQMPMSMKSYRMMPNQLDALESSRRILKRASFNKRRGRELFGKRSSSPSSMPMDYAAALEEGLIYDNRFRRRANELFG